MGQAGNFSSACLLLKTCDLSQTSGLGLCLSLSLSLRLQASDLSQACSLCLGLKAGNLCQAGRLGLSGKTCSLSFSKCDALCLGSSLRLSSKACLLGGNGSSSLSSGLGLSLSSGNGGGLVSKKLGGKFGLLGSLDTLCGKRKAAHVEVVAVRVKLGDVAVLLTDRAQ